MARRPTIIDVASLAGVSKTTVARVINGEYDLVRDGTRDRVLRAVQELGYERNAIASSLRSERTFIIALSIPDITNPFWPEVARGVQDTVETWGFTVVLLNNDWDAARERKHLQMTYRNQFDGLIINPTGTSNADLVALHIPVVVLGSGETFPDFDAVGSDTKQAADTALGYLLSLGHTRIGLIAGLSRRRKSHTRYDSYAEFHQKQGLGLDESLLVESPFTQDGGLAAMRQLLALDKPPTAVFAANDVLALGALIAVEQAGKRVPDDISIIGMDNIYATETSSPPLTTIAKPKYETGMTAAHLLHNRIDRTGEAQQPPEHRLLPCQLIERSSTAPLPGKS